MQQRTEINCPSSGRADTTDPFTASDLVMDVICTTGDNRSGDDQIPCTFPPPAFFCPEVSFIASGEGTCTVRVGAFGSCTNASIAAYELAVTLDGGPALLALVVDD